MKPVYSACLFMLLACAPGWAQSPIPLINQPLIPASVAPGSGAFTLTVNGTGFTSNATLYWNGSLRTTTVVSASKVQAQIAAADVAKASVACVTVGNLGAGEVQSNVVYFPVRTSAKGLGFLPRSIQNITNPGPVAVGDFNNDGLLDFAVGSGTTIQVFLGKGNGTFQPPLSTSANHIVYSMVVGDFNGDGKLDLAVVNAYGDHMGLRVFLGDGMGHFPNVTAYARVDRLLGALATADFNGDGKLDLYFTARQPSSGFYILLGTGNGTFVSGGYGRLSIGGHPPAIGDFNGDGNLDVASIYSGNRVRIFLGDGQGHFSVKRTYALTFGGSAVGAADLNGDGRLDLVTDGVSVLLGKGDGTFRPGLGIASGGTGSVNIADFNGDGQLDIAASASILLGAGNATFQQPLTFASLTSGFPVSIGGFNADGGLDLLGIDAPNGALAIAVQIPIYFTPTNLYFGSQLVGTTSPPQPAALTNFDIKALAISIDITGANAADFAQTNNCGKSLPPGDSCKIQTTFTPSLVGSESASLNVTYKGSAPLSMPLSGTGTDQTFTVMLTPSTLTFGTQLVGTTTPSQPATLTNTGNQPITISNIAVAAPFSQTNNCPSTLQVNSSCLINVVFTPTDKGTVNGTLSVTDDAVGSPQTVELSGTGTAVVLSPTGINFGNEKVGTKSVPVPVTLKNLGTSSLSISQIGIKGTDPNDFSQTNNCGSSLPPQGKCTITVTFTPTAKGARSANVSITDNDPSSPQTVPLSGNGT